MNSFLNILAGTEQRFHRRSIMRSSAEDALKTGRIVEANSPEHVEKRLRRLESMAPATGSPTPPTKAFLEARIADQVLEGTRIGVHYLELGSRRSHSVGRIHIHDGSGRLLGYGTGFLVSPRLILTNHHVIDHPAVAAHSQIEFGYFGKGEGGPISSTSFALNPDAFFTTDQQLDYTIVAIQPSGLDGKGFRINGWIQLLEDESTIVIGEYVTIVHHPHGQPQQVALRHNRVVDVFDTWLHYRSDGISGSSGAPIFNDQWELVAIHHSGVPRRDGKGNILDREGGIWHPSLGESQVDWIAGEGTRISSIVQHIKQLSLDDSQIRLRTELLEIHPQDVITTMEVPAPTGSGPRVEHLATSLQRRKSDITGALKIGMSTSLPKLSISPGDEGLQAALQTLATASERIYYEPEADALARDAYYADIDLNATPTDFFNQLTLLLTHTHHTQPRYEPRRFVYPWIDLQPDLKIRSIYSSKTYEPEDLIMDDFNISLLRSLEISELLFTATAMTSEQIEEQISLLEALLPYNCEHVVPQSWFQKQEPMRGDLHHLFACEATCNSFRGNQAYFDFMDYEEAIKDACGKREENRFEPSSGKGTVARATLYFLLRYPGEINRALGELDIERLPIILAWHIDNPPDDYERHRNMAIFEIQGNRNPFIDHPEWADLIDFTPGFG